MKKEKILSPKLINQQIELMHELYPNNKSELNRETPFQLLSAVMLSAQSTDIQVNKATAKFFDKIRNPQDILDWWFQNLENGVKSIWLYKTKAKNLFATSKILVNEYNGHISDKMEDLIKLPWVGDKTAKVVLHNLYQQSRVAVDTHIHRVANRLGRVKTKTAQKTSEKLELSINNQNKIHAHNAILLFGRYLCIARNPKCNICPFTNHCLWYKTHIINKKSTKQPPESK